MNNSNNEFMINLIALLQKQKSKSSINSDIKELEKVLNKIKLVATIAKGNTKTEINQTIKQMEAQLNQVKLQAKLDNRQLNREIDNALRNVTAKEIRLNLNSGKFRTQIRKAVADARAYVDKNPLKLNINLKKEKLSNQLTAFLNKNTKISESSYWLDEAEKLRNVINSISNRSELRDATDRFNVFTSGVRATGYAAVSTTDRIKNMLGNVVKISNYFGLAYLAVNKFTESLGNLKEMDTILTEISKTTELTIKQLEELGDKSYSIASKYGVLAKNFALSLQEMSRAGFGDGQAEPLAELATLAQSAGALTSELANDYIIASNAAYGYQGNVEKLNALLDAQNQVTNRNAVSMTELASATKVAANQLSNSNISENEMTALLGTGIATTKEEGTVVGRAVKAIVMNLQQIKNTDEGLETTEEDLGKVESRLVSLGIQMKETANGVTVLRSPIAILKELSEVFNSLPVDSAERANIISDIGGKYRGNVLSSILSNWTTYEKMLKDYENAEGSAMREAQKSADSWEGRLAQLQNSWDSFVNSLTNKSVIKGSISFLDNTIQSFEKLTDTIGAIPVLMTTVNASMSALNKDYGITQLFNAETGKIDIQGNFMGIDITAIKAQAKHFQEASEAMNAWNSQLLNGRASINDFGVSVVQNNAQLKAYLQTTSKDAPASLNGYKAYLNATGVSTDALRLKTVLLTSAMSFGLSIAIQAVVEGISKLVNAEEEAVQAAQEASQTYQKTSNSIDDYVERYKELHKALLSAKNNEEETYDVKQQLLELQTELNEKYADEADRINLVNGEYRNQVDVIKELSKVSANSFLNENRKGIEKANKEMNKTRLYSLGAIGGFLNDDEKYITDKIKELASENGITYNIRTGFEIVGNVDEANDSINNFMNQIRELQSESGKTSDTMSGIFESILDKSAKALEASNNVLDEYGEIYEQAQMATIASNENLSNEYNEVISAVEAYNEAVLKSENPYDDENVKSAWDNLQTVKNGIQENEEEWGRYSNIMDNVFASANDKVYSFYDALMNSSELSSFAEELRGLTDVEVKSMVNDGNTDAFDKLAEKAKTYGLEVQDVIDLLIELGYVQGKVIKEVEDVEVSVVPSFDYKKLEDLESSVSSIQSAYDTVIGAIKEYNKQGFLNMDTIDSLIALDDAYINTLIDENGQLQYNSETFKQLAEIKLEEAKASLYQELCTELVRIKELDTALAAQELALANGTLTESAYETAKALYEEILAMGNANSELAKGKWEETQKKVALLDNQIKDVTTSTYDFAKSSGSAKKEFNETMDFFDERIDKINDALSLLKTNIENVVGSFAKNTLIDAQININNEALDNYNDALAMYSQKASEVLSDIPNELRSKVINGDVSIIDFVGDDNEQIVKNIKEYQEWSEKIQQCKQEIVELQETISQLSLDKFKNIAQDFADQFDIRDSIKSNIESHIDLIEKSGEMVGESLFTTLLEQSQKQLQILEREKVALANELTSALSSGNIKKGSDEWLEMVGVLTELDGEIINCKSSIEEFSNEILEIDTKVFERIQKQFSNIDSELKNIVDLMNNYDIVGNNGEFTNEGLVALGALSQKYELAQHQLEQYQSEIAELNEAYADGKVSAIEYSDRLAELVSEQWNCVDSIQNVKNEMVDLHEQRIDKAIEGIEKEKDALRELTDARINELNAQKEADDYKESLEDATKNVTDIERQIAAMQFDTSASGIAKRKQLEEELVKAKKELGKLEKDHVLKTQIDSLEKQYENFETEKDAEIEKLEKSLDDKEKLISDSFETVKQNSNIIGQEIANIANKHGVTISNAIVSSWQSGENAIASYGAVLDIHSSAFIGQLMSVENEVYNLQAQANNTANSLVGMFSTRADNLVNELVSSYNSIGNVNAMTNALKNSLVNTLEGGYNVSGITSALNNITDAANTAKGALDRLQQASGNKVNYAPTPTEIVVVGKTDTSLKTYMDETLESKKQPTSNTSFNNMLDNSMANQFLKKKVSGFSKGGIVTKEDDNILKPIAESVGEDTMVAVKYGESIITKEQRENLHKFLEGWNKDRTVNNTGDSTLLRRQMDGIYDFSGVDTSHFLANYAMPTYSLPKMPEIVSRDVQPNINIQSNMTFNNAVDNTKDFAKIANKEIISTWKQATKQLHYGGF